MAQFKHGTETVEAVPAPEHETPHWRVTGKDGQPRDYPADQFRRTFTPASAEARALLERYGAEKRSAGPRKRG